jgi:DNA-binding HxlR family transcriptional regulator
MFKYHQYCPVARACEILADRWTPLIVRELLFGSRHFNELRRGLPSISRSLLVARLRHLEDNGVIERHTGARPNVTEYILTEAGNDLADVIKQFLTGHQARHSVRG